MGDPGPSDGESRAPKKHKSEQRSSRADVQNGYLNERAPSRSHHERSKHRPRERDDHHGDRRQDGHREDRNQDRYQEREKNYGDKEQDKSRDRYKEQDKSRDRYKEQDNSRYKERDKHSRYEADRSRNHYEERDGHYRERSPPRYKERDAHYRENSPPKYKERDGHYRERSPPPYEERDHQHKERSRNRFDEQERRQERYLQSVDRQGLPMNKKQPEYYYSSERSFPTSGPELQDLEYYEAEPEGGILDCHKCRYLCTGRACCQLVEVLLNMLILICCSVSYNSTGGYTGITNLGGIYYYQFGGAYSGFSGADGEKAQELDVQFYNLKLPSVTASMVFGGALMAFSCLMVLLGVLRVPWHWPIWLLVECGLDIVIAVGYIPALYFYFKHLQDAYNSQVCKDREALYSSKGYQGFSCALHGADIAAALFACMAIIAFIMSALLAIKGFRTVRRQKKKPVNPLEF